ncbi:MAG: hypothetical protein AAGD05_06130 [Bacteroidota bacterium]
MNCCYICAELLPSTARLINYGETMRNCVHQQSSGFTLFYQNSIADE